MKHGNDAGPIRTAHALAQNPREAAAEFHKQIMEGEIALVVFFCSSTYDLDVLGAELKRLFAGVRIVGCTTAGEIGPAGYREHSISGAGFPADTCTAVAGYLGKLKRFSIAEGRTFAQKLLEQLEEKSTLPVEGNSFGFMMIDGLSVREEPVAHVFQEAISPLPLVGGSAGDDMQFSTTYVYHDGRFRTDGALLVLITTSLPFVAFKTQHFIPGEERLVVTEADPARRIVTEINGLTPAKEYARVAGVASDKLTPDCFANSPVVVLIDGTNYVRSIQKVNPDNSLTFYCAIEEGLVFRVARGQDLIGNLKANFEHLEKKIGPIRFVLGCDCILRKLEILHSGLRDEVEAILRHYNMVGFNTYGEQFYGVHVNQTLTGIAVGTPEEASHE